MKDKPKKEYPFQSQRGQRPPEEVVADLKQLRQGTGVQEVGRSSRYRRVSPHSHLGLTGYTLRSDPSAVFE